MSRPIKFRAWYDSKMRYMPNMFVGVAQIGFSNEHYVDLGYHDNEQAEIMQYTGLKDKNGVEIYEGDIVRDKYGFSPAFSQKVIDMERIYAIELPEIYMFWPENQFYDFEELQEHFSEHDDRYGIEVIGNIYSNPELLENENKELLKDE